MEIEKLKIMHLADLQDTLDKMTEKMQIVHPHPHSPEMAISLKSELSDKDKVELNNYNQLVIEYNQRRKDVIYARVKF